MPYGGELYSNTEEKEWLESGNSRLLTDRVAEIYEIHRMSESELFLTPGLFLEFHKLLMNGIYACAGTFRKAGVGIKGSSHVPPRHDEVLGLIENLCEFVNRPVDSDDPESDAVRRAAYVLWKVTWIHPFMGGNGRTARAVCALVLYSRLKWFIPGQPTIAQWIEERRSAYQKGLADSDDAWNQGVVDVDLLEEILEDFLDARSEEE